MSAATRRRRIQTTVRRVGKLPWWSIMMAGIFIYAGFQIINSDRYRDILGVLLDNPTATTQDKFQVTYQVRYPVVVLSTQYVVKLADDSRVDVSGNQVVSREEGTLACDREANPSCLDSDGTLITFRVPVNEGETLDGAIEVRGVLRPDSFVPIADLPDGTVAAVDESTITEREEGTLACLRALNPDCEDLTGEIITFSLPYRLEVGLEARGDSVILYEDGFQEGVRTNRLNNIRTESCEGDFPCVNEEITRATYSGRVTGMEVERNAEQVRVRTVDEEQLLVHRDDIISMETGRIICDREINPRCEDYDGTIIQRRGQRYEGLLTLESDRSYRIIPDGEDSAVEVRKEDVVSEERDPAGCRYDDNNPNPCRIIVQERDNVVEGRILEDNDEGLTVQTVPPVFVEIPREDIIESSSRRSPATCALNNLRGCNAGIWLTILVTVVAYLLALLVGLLVGLMRISDNPLLYHPATLYVEMVRGTPLLVLLLFFAFVVGPELSQVWGFSSFYDVLNDIEVAILGQESFLMEAILGLAVGYAAFLAEVFRAGIESIGKGQMEAARSLGMSYWQAMRLVILPQAVRVVLPPLGNDFIAMLKDSALISVLALPDLLQMGQQYVSLTFQPLPVYGMVALLYILLTLVLSQIVRNIERRVKIPGR